MVQRSDPGPLAGAGCRRAARLVGPWARAVAARTSEEALCRFYDQHHTPGSTLPGLVVRSPAATLFAVLAVMRLPRRRVRTSASQDGRAIRSVLRRRGVAHLLVGTTGLAVLDVPADGAAYSEGRSRQTLRRKVRAAARTGTCVRLVDDPEERRELLRLSVHHERNHPDERYRKQDAGNEDLLTCSTWLAAFSGDGEPLVLAVTPVDGEWAALLHFRSLGTGPSHSDARYLLSQALVEHLSLIGVRALLETYNPAHLTPGLRQFQRLLGYRLVRLRAERKVGGRAPGA